MVLVLEVPATIPAPIAPIATIRTMMTVALRAALSPSTFSDAGCVSGVVIARAGERFAAVAIGAADASVGTVTIETAAITA